MRLELILKGNSIRIGKDYNALNGSEIKILLYLQCISNVNNYVALTNINILSDFMETDKRTLGKYIISLEKLNRIRVFGDLNKSCNIEIIKNESDTYELFTNMDFILSMLRGLTDAELKLYCAMSTFLNFKENSNYLYPSIEVLVESYYSKNELSDDNSDKERYINRLKNNLIEKGYIKKVAAFYFYKNDISKGHNTSLGYFLKTGQHEVADTSYDNFIKSQIIKYNESHKNNIALATKEYLEKCKYKNLDSYIYYIPKEITEESEIIEDEPVVGVEKIENKDDIYELFKYIVDGDVNRNYFNKRIKEIKVSSNEYTDEVIYKTIHWEKDNELNYLCSKAENINHKVNLIFKYLKENIDGTIEFLNRKVVNECTEEKCDELDMWEEIDNKIDVSNKSNTRRTIKDILEKVGEEKAEYKRKTEDIEVVYENESISDDVYAGMLESDEFEQLWGIE